MREGHGDVVDVARLPHLGPAAVGHLQVLLTVRLRRPSALLLALPGACTREGKGGETSSQVEFAT